ncbi:hypothetical protein V8F33_002851 [Rhypophila sp. PSN 637]
MRFSNWEDPLNYIPDIPRHPSISAEDLESGYKSPLPSVDENTDYTLDLKERAILVLNRYKPSTESDDTAKVLGAFIDYLPSEGQVVLMQEIQGYADDLVKLRQLRNFMVDAILKPMKVAGGRSPHVPWVPASGFEDEMDDDQSKLRQECLKRDNHRCVISGILDTDHFFTLTRDERKGLVTGGLECAHILPFAIGEFDERSEVQVRKRATIWGALYRYFAGLLSKDIIQAGTINQCENVMMLLQPLQRDFGAYKLALEPLEKRSQYRCHLMPGMESSLTGMFTPSDPVEFQQHSAGQSVPMPNPDLLRVHYIVANILDVTGLGDRIDRTLDESPDGSTDLGYALAVALLAEI